MSQTISERTVEHIGQHIDDSVRQASRASAKIGDAIEDGLGVVRRAVKQGGDAADELTQRLQRHPTLTIATTFAAGVIAGALIGWMMKRR